LSNLSLKRKISLIIYFSDDIWLRWSFPKALASRSSCCKHEAASHIGLSAYVLVLKHQAYVNFCVFGYFDAELRVVEPFVIALGVQVLVLKPLLWLIGFFLSYNRAASSIGFGSPLTLDWVNFPVLWKYFVDVHTIKLDEEISKGHPPRAIWLFGFGSVFDILLHCFVLLPIVSLLTERTSPYSLIAPGISQTY
jgi:hypothetical protein